MKWVPDANVILGWYWEENDKKEAIEQFEQQDITFQDVPVIRNRVKIRVNKILGNIHLLFQNVVANEDVYRTRYLRTKLKEKIGDRDNIEIKPPAGQYIDAIVEEDGEAEDLIVKAGEHKERMEAEPAVQFYTEFDKIQEPLDYSTETSVKTILEEADDLDEDKNVLYEDKEDLRVLEAYFSLPNLSDKRFVTFDKECCHSCQYIVNKSGRTVPDPLFLYEWAS